MTTHMERLLDFAASIGVTVRFDDPRVPAGDPNPQSWSRLGIDATDIPLGVNGLAYVQKPVISLRFEDGAPEWLQVGILAHELGHKVDNQAFGLDYRGIISRSRFNLMMWGEDKDVFDLEARASERAFELCYALGIDLTSKLRACLNYSIGNHALYNGLTWEDGEERFL